FAALTPALIEHLIARQGAARPRMDRLWSYYRNQELPGWSLPARSGSTPSSPRCRLAQERGLPTRVTGTLDPTRDDRAAKRREVVIENDIGWRIQAMVDFMFGKPVLITSTARDEATRREIERTLDDIWEASGGISLLQDMALLGHVYGHIDLMLRE